jgi:hypothetical protein
MKKRDLKSVGMVGPHGEAEEGFTAVERVKKYCKMLYFMILVKIESGKENFS